MSSRSWEIYIRSVIMIIIVIIIATFSLSLFLVALWRAGPYGEEPSSSWPGMCPLLYAWPSAGAEERERLYCGDNNAVALARIQCVCVSIESVR